MVIGRSESTPSELPCGIGMGRCSGVLFDYHPQIRVILPTSEMTDAQDALLTWLSDLTGYASTARGLATALTHDGTAGSGEGHASACSAKLSVAGISPAV